ncbi:hypothetical protein AAHC03_019407 [Spirometra sp. Aus1]
MGLFALLRFCLTVDAVVDVLFKARRTRIRILQDLLLGRNCYSRTVITTRDGASLLAYQSTTSSASRSSEAGGQAWSALAFPENGRTSELASLSFQLFPVTPVGVRRMASAEPE